MHFAGLSCGTRIANPLGMSTFSTGFFDGRGSVGAALSGVMTLVTRDSEEEVARVSTLGMVDHGLPELALDRVSPHVVVPYAADVLLEVGAYMAGARVRLGQTMAIDRMTVVRFGRGGVDESGSELWLLLDEPDICPDCEGADHMLYARDGDDWLN